MLEAWRSIAPLQLQSYSVVAMYYKEHNRDIIKSLRIFSQVDPGAIQFQYDEYRDFSEI